MKIIAKTSGGYLVEMNADEILKAAGYSSTYDDGWTAALRTAGVYDRGGPPIGMKIEVQAAYDFHSRIASNEHKAKEAAGTLRALASLLDGVMPSVVIPPAVEAATSQEVGAAK